MPVLRVKNNCDLLSFRERPLIKSDVRVGRGVQIDLKIGRFRVKKGR